MDINDQRQQMLGILRELLKLIGFKAMKDDELLLTKTITEPGAQIAINGRIIHTQGKTREIKIRAWSDGPCEDLDCNRGFDLVYFELSSDDGVVQNTPGCSVYYDNAEQEINDILNHLYI